ncbi:flavin monoamine oxidase family protein [Salininema proteolyticum]|uniref:Flavin monoamine oxidase family protein n=1 Tax=Salininema proteolyticum TaxID=1607685 RepID=A0ABV8U258_9ACTN
MNQSTRDRVAEVAADITRTTIDGASRESDYLDLLAGSGPSRAPRSAVIVGAGIAGLAAAGMLRRAGCDVTVVEANTNRVGGRVKTVRSPWALPGSLGEAGAMRLPTSHTLATALVDDLGLETRPFAMTSADRLVDAGSARVTRAEYLADPALINGQFGVDGDRTAYDILAECLSSARPSNDDPEGWRAHLEQYGEWSLRRWLVEHCGLSENELDLVGTLGNTTARMHLSLTHSLLSAGYLGGGARLVEVVGGTDRMVDGLAERAGRVRTGWRAVEVDTTGPEAAVRCRREFGTSEREFRADTVIVTCPHPTLRYIRFTPELSYGKQRAVTELHYDAATKILLEFESRWWEKDGAEGGADVTDGPLRNIVYPSHPVGDGGVVIASYTWSDDARGWDSLPEGECLDRSLRSLAELYGPVVQDSFTGGFHVQSWARNAFAGGEAAVYVPGQAVEIGPETRSPEAGGRLVFAGDGTSTAYRCWIEGALESACRAVEQLAR